MTSLVRLDPGLLQADAVGVRGPPPGDEKVRPLDRTARRSRANGLSGSPLDAKDGGLGQDLDPLVPEEALDRLGHVGVFAVDQRAIPFDDGHAATEAARSSSWATDASSAEDRPGRAQRGRAPDALRQGRHDQHGVACRVRGCPGERASSPSARPRPDGPHRMVLRDQFVDRAGSDHKLLAVGTSEARRRIAVGGRLRRLGRSRLLRMVCRSCGVAHRMAPFHVGVASTAVRTVWSRVECTQ